MTSAAPAGSEPPRILLIGLGDLGGVILEFLARDPRLNRIVVGSRSPEKGLARCNLARLGGLAQGYQPEIDFVAIDLKREEETAETIARIDPDLILLSATLQTWWLLDLLPASHSEPVARAGFGIWLPVHLALARHLMRILKRIDYHGLTLTAPYPDVVNCVLGRLGLAPTCGIGNIAEVEARVRAVAASRLATTPRSIKVWMVCHHALEARLSGRSNGDLPPFHLRIERDGRDVTEQAGGSSLLTAPWPMPGGRLTHFLTAATAVRLMRSLLVEPEGVQHVPGPNGLPGGYPVRAERSGVTPLPIPGLNPRDAIAINERSQPYDGIERIEPDGSVVFAAESVQALKDTLGYDCVRLAPDEIDAKAEELTARFREYGEGLGVRWGPV